jgi:hypothetical protein
MRQLQHGAVRTAIYDAGRGRLEIVRVVYSDEMGVAEMDRITVVAAIMMNLDVQWKAVETDLKNIVAEMPSDYLVGGTELKGARLLKKIRKQKPRAAEFLIRSLRVPVNNCVPIFYGAVDRAGLGRRVRRDGFGSADVNASKYAAFDMCMATVRQYVQTLLPGDHVLWIADDAGSSEPTFKQSVKFHQEKVFATGDLDVITHFVDSPFVDTVYFGASHESRALQLADVCGTVICEYLHGKEDAREFYDVIRKGVITEGPVPWFSDEP